MTDKLLILTTAGSQTEANKIAQVLIERRLAACVNIVPQIQSVYRWKGDVESSQEFLLLIKTRRGRETQVQAAIREQHSYDLPEHLVVAIEQGSEEYLKWIDNSVE
jgi:periplasmic divalent cation tolerance protein